MHDWIISYLSFGEKLSTTHPVRSGVQFRLHDSSYTSLADIEPFSDVGNGSLGLSINHPSYTLDVGLGHCGRRSSTSRLVHAAARLLEALDIVVDSSFGNTSYRDDFRRFLASSIEKLDCALLDIVGKLSRFFHSPAPFLFTLALGALRLLSRH